VRRVEVLKIKINMKSTAILLLCCLLLGGCGWATKGGRAAFQSPAFAGGIEQPENPKDATTGEYVESRPDGTKIVWKTRIGAAQKNTLAETAAKLKSLRPVMFLGIFVFLFGVASAFWPPLKLIIGSFTTSAALAAAGMALIILPSVISGNEILIIAATLGIAVAYWWAHRHGELRGEVKLLKGQK
jgi:hypothetical protein